MGFNYGNGLSRRKGSFGCSLLILGTVCGDVLALNVSAGQLKWRVSDCHSGWANFLALEVEMVALGLYQAQCSCWGSSKLPLKQYPQCLVPRVCVLQIFSYDCFKLMKYFYFSESVLSLFSEINSESVLSLFSEIKCFGLAC